QAEKGHGEPCKEDFECQCPFVCHLGGEDRFKCQLTDTRGEGETCDPNCEGNPNAACKEGLECSTD
ncbi:9320_t:CDS:1, partial [Cetraspora pellucida]